jgi:hypothetical protein
VRECEKALLVRKLSSTSLHSSPETHFTHNNIDSTQRRARQEAISPTRPSLIHSRSPPKRLTLPKLDLTSKAQNASILPLHPGLMTGRSTPSSLGVGSSAIDPTARRGAILLVMRSSGRRSGSRGRGRRSRSSRSLASSRARSLGARLEGIERRRGLFPQLGGVERRVVAVDVGASEGRSVESGGGSGFDGARGSRGGGR